MPLTLREQRETAPAWHKRCDVAAAIKPTPSDHPQALEHNRLLG